MRLPLIASAALFMLAVPAQAEDERPFSGPTVAVSGGFVQHHFAVVENGTTREVDGLGAGGAVVLGYGKQVSERILVGAEGSYHFGGTTADTTVFGGQGRFGIDPRWGWSGVAKLGYIASPRLMLFATAGYGEHRYREIIPAGPVLITSSFDKNSSFVLGTGAEYRLNPRFALRADLRHLDGTRNEVLIGVQARF